MKQKFYLPSFDHTVANFFESLGMTCAFLGNAADFVVFTGGSDVSAVYYGETNHATMSVNLTRDEREFEIYKEAKAAGKKMIGICRGAQFLHVMNGGKMWQNVDNHAVRHGHEVLDLKTNKSYHCSSTHHQMMRVDNPLAEVPRSFEVVAVAAESSLYEMGREIRLVEDDTKHFSDDIEVLWYPETKCLCYQPHPEYGRSEDVKYFISLMRRYFPGTEIIGGGAPKTPINNTGTAVAIVPDTPVVHVTKPKQAFNHEQMFVG